MTSGSGAAAAAMLGLLVFAAVFVAMALPRASLDYRTNLVQQALRATPAADTTVLADADFTGLTQTDYSTTQTVLTARQAGLDGRWLARTLQGTGLPLAPVGQWGGLTASSGQLSGAPEPPPGSLAPSQVELLYRTGLDRNARLVAGSLPVRAQRTGTSVAYQVAVTAATANRLGLRVGSRLRDEGQPLVVSGIIRPTSPASSFWTLDPSAAAPLLTYPPTQAGTPFLSTAMFVGAAEFPALETDLGGQQLTAVWTFPLALGHVSVGQAASLLRVLQRLPNLPMAIGTATSSSLPLEATFSVGVTATALPSVVASDAAVQRALAPVFVSLAAVAALMMLLAARLASDHRRGEFALMRARGAGLAHVAALALGGAAATVLPAAAVAVTAGILVTPGPSSALALWLAAVITGPALAGPALFTAWQLRARHADPAPAGRRRARAARRWVAEGALCCAAAGGLILLRQQGVSAGGPDLFTSLAPVLAAVPIALFIVRCYPLALRLLARLARRRRGAVMLIGVARGRAASRATLLPAFALILAFALISFAAMARDAVTRAQVAASWQATPADAVITAPISGPGLPPGALSMITRVAGVQHVATVSVTTGSVSGRQPLTVAVLNPRQYAQLVAATPEPRFPARLLAQPRGARMAARQVPVLVSATARALLGHSDSVRVDGRSLRLHIAGRLPASIAGVPSGRIAVIPAWALGSALPPTVIAIQGAHLAAATLVRVVHDALPRARLTLRSRLLAALQAAPLPHGGMLILAQSALAVGAFALLILLLMLVLSNRSRELTLTRLAAMGLSRGQSRRITMVETIPVILAAALGGTACALALVPLVGPAIDLAAFTSSPAPVPLRADPLALGAVAGGLLLLGGVTLNIQDWLARGRSLGHALRADDVTRTE